METKGPWASRFRGRTAPNALLAKAPLRFLVGIGLVCVGASAQVRIDSINRNGELTWTNSVSNATYRVEWAGSLEGPWQPASALTNLDSIIASNTTVRVTVPMFYRVVWTDPPAPKPVGDWAFNGYDAAGSLVVTGLVSIPEGYSTNSLSWSFALVPSGTNSLPMLPCDAGVGFASLTGFSLGLYLDGPVCPVEGAYLLEGTLFGDVYSGRWYREGVVLNPIGRFVALRKTP